MPLLSEIDSPAIEKRVLKAARYRLGVGRHGRSDYQADYEHGQWWVTDRVSGAQWSVVTCQTRDGNDYLDFEQVTQGEEE